MFTTASARYYSERAGRYGATPLGVDWTCALTQQLRFAKLLKVCDFARAFSLNDLGCGYGALLDFLAQRHPETDVDYLGVDLSEAMIGHAKRRRRYSGKGSFRVGNRSPRVADYSVASGGFNVMLEHPVPVWECFVAETLRGMHASSRRGFAVNFLAPRPGGGAFRSGLYRVAPDRWIDYCEREFGWRAELVAGYGLREFTLLVRAGQSGRVQQ